MQNGSGQVVKGVELESPSGEHFVVLSSSRKAINSYQLRLQSLQTGETIVVMNKDLRKDWLAVRFLTPEEIAAIYNKPLDPDANLPRPMRESFWKMRSKPGTFNYRQKKRLMQLPEYQKFSKYFTTTVVE